MISSVTRLTKSKEKLREEAEENSFRYTLDKPWVCEVERKQIMTHFEKGYLAGAEPREKRITELEEKLAISEHDREHNDYELTEVYKKVEQLEKEKAELKNRDCWKSCEYANPKAELIEQHIKDVQNLTKAKEIMNIAVEGIKHWGIVGGTERPFEKQAEKLFNLFLDKAEQFLSETEG